MGRRTFGMLAEPVARGFLQLEELDLSEDRIAASILPGLCDALDLFDDLTNCAPQGSETRARLADLTDCVAQMLHSNVVVAARQPKPRFKRRKQ